MTRPPVTYPVNLADLELFTDAAAELDTMRRFYIDQPGEQVRISGMVRRMYDAIERVAAHDINLILIRADGSEA